MSEQEFEELERMTDEEYSRMRTPFASREEHLEFLRVVLQDPTDMEAAMIEDFEFMVGLCKAELARRGEL